MLRKVAASLRQAVLVALRAQPKVATAMLEQYVRGVPSPQNAVDVFKGDWWSALPPPWDRKAQAGHLPLFEDKRLHWGIEALGGVRERSILELGPLEGAHTYALEKAGAASILAVEASTRAFLKCLIVKEIVGMPRSHFVLGDFEAYLRVAEEHFDAVIASGVLYHLRNPVELLYNVSRVTDRVYIWTQYYVKERVEAIEHMAGRFHAGLPAEVAGFRHTLHRYDYGDFLDTTRFAGGSEEYSCWLSRDDLLGALRYFGFDEVEVGDEEVYHPNGSAIALVATRTKPRIQP